MTQRSPLRPRPPKPDRTFDVYLTTTGIFTGTIRAPSAKAAIEEAHRIWRTEVPHPFAQPDYLVLVKVTARETRE